MYIIATLKVYGHPKNVMFAMKTHTLIYLMSSQMKSNTDKTLTRLEIMIYLKSSFCPSKFDLITESICSR